MQYNLEFFKKHETPTNNFVKKPSKNPFPIFSTRLLLWWQKKELTWARRRRKLWTERRSCACRARASPRSVRSSSASTASCSSSTRSSRDRNSETTFEPEPSCIRGPASCRSTLGGWPTRGSARCRCGWQNFWQTCSSSTALGMCEIQPDK